MLHTNYYVVFTFLFIPYTLYFLLCTICYRTSPPSTPATTSTTSRTTWSGFRKGTNGVGTNGVTAFLLGFWHRDFFLVLPLTYFYLPKSARAYPFPQSVKTRCFCSGPISVDPICPQPRIQCHRKSTMISEVSISGVQSFATDGIGIPNPNPRNLVN